MTIRGNNTILYCRHWAETVHFYERRLHVPVTMRRDWFVEFRLGPDTTLSIADEQRATIKSGGGAGVTISLRVPDAEQTRSDLVSDGLDPEPLRSIWGARAFFLRDPEGHRLEFWS